MLEGGINKIQAHVYLGFYHLSFGFNSVEQFYSFGSWCYYRTLQVRRTTKITYEDVVEVTSDNRTLINITREKFQTINNKNQSTFDNNKNVSWYKKVGHWTETKLDEMVNS